MIAEAIEGVVATVPSAASANGLALAEAPSDAFASSREVLADLYGIGERVRAVRFAVYVALPRPYAEVIIAQVDSVERVRGWGVSLAYCAQWRGRLGAVNAGSTLNQARYWAERARIRVGRCEGMRAALDRAVQSTWMGERSHAGTSGGVAVEAPGTMRGDA